MSQKSCSIVKRCLLQCEIGVKETQLLKSIRLNILKIELTKTDYKISDFYILKLYLNQL